MWEKIKKSFLESNRNKHFYYSIILGALFTIICPISANTAMEYKDKQFGRGNYWDWQDLLWGYLGGLIGQLIQLFIIYLIWF